jgi:LPXTG-motif cell wall-anchored protein
VIARRAAAALALAFALALPAPAMAQGQQPPDAAPPLESAPPSGGEEQAPPPPMERPAARAPGLPSTGSDAGLLGLAGIGMLMTGLGLRLRVQGA